MNKSSLALAVAIATLASQASAGGFIEDSSATLNLRNFYYDLNHKNTANSEREVNEWGQGFIFNYSSGFTEGTVGFGLDAVGLVGVKLDSGGRTNKAGRDRQPGALFPTDSNGKAVDSYGKSGVTAKARLSKTELRVGTLQPKLPVVVFNDGRLLPQFFEGGQITVNEIDGLSLTAGQLGHTKTRSSTDSVRLSLGGSTNGADTNKFYFAGGDYKLNSDLTLQYYYGNLHNFYQQHFLGLTHNWKVGPGTLKSDLRYFDSRSDGKNGGTSGRAEGYTSSGYWKTGATDRGEVDNRTFSGLFTYSLAGHSLGLGYQQLNGDSAFPFLNQGDGASAYLITDRQIAKFANAGERTWLAEYAYDFANLGIPGLKTAVAYLRGDNIKAASNDRKEWERDFRIDYTLQDGALKGLGLSWRNATFRGNTSAVDVDENRLIVSYTLPLL